MTRKELVSRAWEEVWRLGVRRGSSGNGSEVYTADQSLQEL